MVPAGDPGVCVMTNRLPLKDRMRDHPMFAEPEEEPWCEDCGASEPFCECNAALNFEEEGKDE